MIEPMVSARNVHKSFGSLKVLNGVDLTVERGEVVCLLGPSGSGKTTFLRCVNHLEKLDGGEIYVDGGMVGYNWTKGTLRESKDRDIARARAQIGMVFQSFNLFPHLTVLQNVVEGPLRVMGVSRNEATAQARGLLTRVGLIDKCDNHPRQLSGGQQQRVAIARALAMRPKLMLFDEPTSALDPELVGEVLDVIRDVASGGITMMIVTHEIGFAREVADTVVFMDAGSVVEKGPAKQVIDHPAEPRTQDFIARVL